MKQYLPNVLVGLVCFVGTIAAVAAIPKTSWLQCLAVAICVGAAGAVGYCIGLYVGSQHEHP
jgi:uncharacterized membrane protein